MRSRGQTTAPHFDTVERDYPADRLVHGDGPLRSRIRIRVKMAVRYVLATGSPAEPPANRYRVIAVLGQSNAHGAGWPVPGSDPVTVDARVHQWPGSGLRRRRILHAKEPLLHRIPGAGVGFATTFGSLLAEDLDEHVLLVPCALGDTSFYPKNGFTWDPDDNRTRVNLFDAAIRQIDAALAASNSDLAGILWHQGETDAPLLPPDDYATRLDRLIARLRSRYGPVPVIVGGMVPEWIAKGHKKLPLIDAVHRATPERHERCVFVEGPEAMFNGPEAKFGGRQQVCHYNADGAREMGRRMFTAWRSLAGA